MDAEEKTGEQVIEDAAQTTVDDSTKTAGVQQTVETPADEGSQLDAKYKAAIAQANDERTKRQAKEQETQLLREQLALVQAGQTRQPSAPVSTYEQAITELGIDTDYMTETERIKVFRRKEQLDQQRYQQEYSQNSNRNFILSHSDYYEVVGRPHPITGQTVPSTEIIEILQKKPYLTAAAYASAEGAYSIVLQERELKKLAEKTSAFEQQNQVQNTLDNKTSPLSSSAAGGGASVIGSMKLTTREEVAAMEARVAAGEFDRKG